MVKYTGNKKGTRDATRAGAIDLALDDATGYWTGFNYLLVRHTLHKVAVVIKWTIKP